MAETPPEGFLAQLKWLIERQVHDRIDLIKLEGAEKIARLSGVMISGLMIAMIGFFALLFFSLLSGYWFAQFTGSLAIGFGIVAVFYLLIFLWAVGPGRKKITTMVANMVIREIFEEDEINEPDQDEAEEA